MKNHLQFAQYLPKLTLQVDNVFSNLGGLAQLLSSLLWPVITLVLFFYLFLSRSAPQRLRELFGGLPLESLTLFGAKFKLNVEMGNTIDKAFKSYRMQTNKEYDRVAENYELMDKLEQVVQNEVIRVLGKDIRDIQGFRCTIHVLDVLFAETLYQLLDYYPRGIGRGRRLSFRFGIIGKAWRLGQPETKGQVQAEINNLILEWGMTNREAFGQGRQSFTCVVLKDDVGSQVGIFYMDSTEKNAFVANDADNEAKKRLHKAISDGCTRTKLTESLANLKDELQKELRPREFLIRIHG